MAGLHFEVNDSDLVRIAEMITRSSGEAQHTVALQVARDTSPFVPMLTGSLDQRTQVIGNTIIYPGPYARYLYYGKLMVDPVTGSAWAREGATKVLTDQNLVFNHASHRKAQAYWFEASKAQNMDKWIRIAARAMQHEYH